MSLLTVDNETDQFTKTFILNNKYISLHAIKDTYGSSAPSVYFVTIRTLYPCGSETTVTKKWSLNKLNKHITKYSKHDVGSSFKSLETLERNPELYSSFCGLPLRR
jgi:hypothetical protein